MEKKDNIKKRIDEIYDETVEIRRDLHMHPELTVSGKSCHGAHPDDGADPILAASHIVAGLQSIISRNLSPANPGLITVGKFISGTANNVIPEKAVLSGIIRALDNETQRFIKDRLFSLASSTAEAFGTIAEVCFRDSYPALVNDDFLLDTFHA